MFLSINSKQCVLINNIYKSCFRPLNQLQRRCYSSSVRCKVAIVTGGARGIGFHIAQSILDAGAHSVVIADILEDECREAAAKLNRRYGGPRAFPQKCDVSNINEMEKLFQKGNLKYTDIIINNAGVEDNQNYENMLRTNINGLINGTMLGFKYLRKGGTIINVASIDGLQPSYYSPIYSGINAFSVGYTRSFGHAYFYQLKKIKLMALCPGYTKTLMHDNKKLGLPGLPDSEKIICSQPLQDPEEVGNCVITMLEDRENGSVWIVENNQCYKYVPPDRMSLSGVPECAKRKHSSNKEDTNVKKKSCQEDDAKWANKSPVDEVLHKKTDPCEGSDYGNKVEWRKQPTCTGAKKMEDTSKNKNPCKKTDETCKKDISEKLDPCKKSVSSNKSDPRETSTSERNVSKVEWTKQPRCADAKKVKEEHEVVTKKDPCKNKAHPEKSNPCKKAKPSKESNHSEKSDPCLKPKPCKELVDTKVKWTKQPKCSEAKKTGSDEKKNVFKKKNNCEA